MASSSFLFFLFLFCLSLIQQPPISTANLQTTSSLFRSQLISESNSVPTTPTTFFEVTKPIPLPNTKPCSNLVLRHDFAYTYGEPPVFADYKPPSNCPSKNFAKIVLEWTATCKGRQFDRIFGVWLGGVEVLRSCTAEPRATGIVWTVKKDVTRSIISSGWVESSYGVITTKSLQGFNYSNTMVMGNEADLQILNQIIYFNRSVDTKMSSSSFHSAVSLKKFGFHLFSDNVDKGNGTYVSIANVTLSMKEKEEKASEFGSSTSSLKNLQNAQGYMLVKGNLVISGLGSTQQEYHYIGDESCYFRNVSSSNYTILHDEQSNACQYHKRCPLSTQKPFLI